MKQYTYNKQASKLIERATFGRADHWNTESEAEHQAVEEAYLNLRQIDCSHQCREVWEDGQSVK